MAAAGAAETCSRAWAQDAGKELVSAPEPTVAPRPRVLPERLPERPSQAPAFSIPVEPLGFSAPGANYLGQRNSLVSLDFLDEGHLLFTFRVPGLIRRDPADADAGSERQIRALVLALPEGTVLAEALWTVHDRARYLWMLKDGHFLLRDRENLERGDRTLELKPYLRFPGPLVWLEADPAQNLLVTDSREPASAETKAAQKAGTPVPPDRASLAGEATNGQGGEGSPEMVVRILRRESGEVMLVSRTRSAVHLPINGDGYLESLRSRGNGWLLSWNSFRGGTSVLGRIDSSCSPLSEFLSQRELLVTTCTPSGTGRLVAMTTEGRRLWEAETSSAVAWPLGVKAADGSRLVREVLVVSHPVNAYAPLASDDIKGQLVEVLNAADGAVVLESPASPVLDAGGNVALSPSGRRAAVLNGGAIQVFELLEPPLVP